MSLTKSHEPEVTPDEEALGKGHDGNKDASASLHQDVPASVGINHFSPSCPIPPINKRW